MSEGNSEKVCLCDLVAAVPRRWTPGEGKGVENLRYIIFIQLNIVELNIFVVVFFFFSIKVFISSSEVLAVPTSACGILLRMLRRRSK